MIDDPIQNLKDDLVNRPSISLLYAARWILATIPRVLLPDWVEAVGNGHPEYWTEALDVARVDMQADEKPVISAQKGHTMTAYGTLLGLAVLACGILFGLFTVARPQLANALANATAAITVDTTFSHGAAKHGADVAATIDTCFDKHGVWQEWVNPTNGRHARVCKMDNGKFGIQVLQNVDGTWQEITKFVKEKLNSWGQVSNYLKNSGYEPIH